MKLIVCYIKMTYSFHYYSNLATDKLIIIHFRLFIILLIHGTSQTLNNIHYALYKSKLAHAPHTYKSVCSVHVCTWHALLEQFTFFTALIIRAWPHTGAGPVWFRIICPMMDVRPLRQILSIACLFINTPLYMCVCVCPLILLHRVID